MRKKALLKCIGRTLLVALAALFAALVLMAAYHHIRLTLDSAKIKPIGTLVEVDGFHMNVLVEGERSAANDLTLVLLSGSGVAAPVYDYKVLYSKLSGSYEVAVLEKFGYGYSDVSGLPRDVATLVEQDRAALEKAGLAPPFVLMPHSMSALEAIYWVNTYPGEIEAVIGLDMAVPNSYQVDNLAQIKFLKASVFFGLHRLPLFNPVSRLGLTDAELEQHMLLNARNSLNTDVYEECRVVMQNARAVGNMDITAVPMLMFTTNLGGGAGGAQWMAAQDEFAAPLRQCTQIRYDCGHNLHYFKSEEMAREILEFLRGM